MSSGSLNWGILGAGNIAKAFARGVAGSETGKLVAIGSRDQAKADAFGNEFNVPHRHGTYEALLANPAVHAVYIATPHPQHAQWAIRAAEAKKHLLIEKPIGINAAEAMAIIEAAKENDVFLMEAFMYRCHPQTAKLVELLRQRIIGDVRVIHASFSFQTNFNPAARLFANNLAGGGILDVGGYTVSMARLIAGAATGKDFAEPIDVKGIAHLGATGVDEYAAAVLKFPGDIVAELATGITVPRENAVRVFGSEGSIFVPSPWIPAREGGATKIIVQRNSEKEAREIVIDTRIPLYGIEADTVARYIDQRQAASPAMTWDDTLGNMRVLDQWRQSVGLVYEMEKAANLPTASRRPLAVRATHNMKYGQIAGLEKPVSRLVMGCDNQPNLPHAAVMFDDFFERGGNTFDSAWVYGGGLHERLLGQWIKARGLREKVVVIAKGAHTPSCWPEMLTVQFIESLSRLETDHADIYIMHRDNPSVPAGEFVDVLNEHVRAGRIRIFGGSNWATARVDEANEYARKKGLAGFSVVSNNFSLARMVQPIWGGCISASDADSRAWFSRTQTPLLAWSSQARGFFLPGNASPEKKTDGELVRTWYCDDNFTRLARVNELAKQRGVLPINIALAYVLNQPFPTYALIGPRKLAETRTSLPGLDIELSREELMWLNLEDK